MAATVAKTSQITFCPAREGIIFDKVRYEVIFDRHLVISTNSNYFNFAYYG
jgi:hypothetical protein